MRYRTLSRELDGWVAERLVLPAQAEAILRRTAARSDTERRDRVISILAVIGAVVGGLGVILFFAANWDAIPRPARVALLLATMVGAYSGGSTLLARRPATGRALLLLGAITFGASLFLVGQMYHVQAHDPLALLVWTAACVPVALVVRTRAMAALSILTFGGWLVFELTRTAGGDGVLEYTPIVAALYGAGLYAWGTWLRDAVFSGPMRGLGFAIAAFGTFVLTFPEAVEQLDGRGPLGTVELVALTGLVAAALAGAAVLAVRRRSPIALAEAGAVAAVAALPVAAVLVPEAGDALGYPILFNVLLAVIALGAIVVGLAREEVWLANGGIALVAIDVFARYVDVFWELLPRSLGFLGAGLLLLVLAFGLERQRARLGRRLETT